MVLSLPKAEILCIQISQLCGDPSLRTVLLFLLLPRECNLATVMHGNAYMVFSKASGNSCERVI